jgi:hypothetical protein
MNRALPPGDRGNRNAAPRWQSRSRRAMPRSFGLVCGASDSHEQVNCYARETIEAVGTSGTAPRSGDAIEGRRAPAGRSDRRTDHSNTSRASGKTRKKATPKKKAPRSAQRWRMVGDRMAITPRRLQLAPDGT